MTETLKIIAVADFHDDEEALERLIKHLEEEVYDYLLIAGDVGVKFSYAEDLINGVDKRRTFYVPGNNEPPDVVELFSREKMNIHGKVVELHTGLLLAGFGYSNPTPFHTPGELSEEEIRKGLSNTPCEKDCILLTHVPPKGILDETKRGDHIGSSSLMEFVEKTKPKLHVFGHVHEVVGIKRGETTFVNLPPAFSLRAGFIELEEEDRVNIFFGKL